ncbi:MAG: hypothetical protein ACKO9F_07875 [Caldilinea sp.]
MDLGFWRDLVLFYLLSMQLIVTLVAAGVLYLCVRGAQRVRHRATEGMHRLRSSSSSMRSRSDQLAERVAAPWIRSAAAVARAKASVRALLPGRSKLV